MNQTATPPNEAMFAAILETLLRLEGLFSDHRHQLQSAKAAVMASDIHHTAYPLDTSDLMHSLANLHNRFEFDDGSQQDLKSDKIDCYSISIYPSRPLSCLDPEGDPTPEVCTLPSLLGLRYEDIPAPPPTDPLRQLHSSSSAASNLPSDQRQGFPAANSATTSPRSSASDKTWSMTGAFNSIGTRRLSMRQARIIRRTRSSDSNTDSTDQSLVSMAAGQAEKLLVAAGWVSKRTRSVLGLVPRAVSAAARAMINQQFKKLDVVS